MKPALHIGELHLRVDGVSDAQARRLAELIGACLAQSPPGADAARRVDSMKLRIRRRPTRSLDELAAEIAQRLRDQLR